ncbi:MAG: hypothetical protein IRY91_05610 [Gemmatimonadaceae bacterium]|nr:hypothetical protein [Gemmatimonadaceae bacterium]
MTDRAERARIEALLRGIAAVRTCERPSELARRASEMEVGAVIYEVTGHEGPELTDVLQTLRRRFPDFPLLFVIGLSDAGTTDRAAALATTTNPSSMVFRGVTDMRSTIDAILDEAAARSAAGRIIATVDRLRPDLDPLVRDFIVHTATSRNVARVSRVTAALHASGRTLARRLREERLPTAHVLFWTIMVLRAAYLLRDPFSTQQRVVDLLPFPDQSAVTTRFHRYLGMTPSDRARLRNADRIFAHFEALLTKR